MLSVQDDDKLFFRLNNKLFKFLVHLWYRIVAIKLTVFVVQVTKENFLEDGTGLMW